ncbi:uncharacterized protein LOC108038021 [Drosophila rhopaloa]|uniref:Uncharacterized protein LOC108038021 n=1 Tax=Drosophila rhopaloa TaxID=1041015 RepID=A0A6P4E9W7_DRORH|nr:uncharacterized protein LOC108038021 [Drosophila rhopaloa]
MRIQSVLRTIWRQACRSYSCKVPTFPDSVCHPVDPECHHVPDGKCQRAKEVLTKELPREKFLEQSQELEVETKCCVLRSAAKNPCAVMKRPKVAKQPQKPFRSMWEPPCQTDEQPFCKDKLPRFDAIYYHPSNKCRCYQRTWVECPPVKQRLKKVCCLDSINPPEVRYRIKDPCWEACEKPNICPMLICKKDDLERDPTGQCSRLYWPCCKPARCDPHCRYRRGPTKCTKLRAPFPSYSEVGRWARPRRRIECHCLDTVPQCVALQERMKRDRGNLK